MEDTVLCRYDIPIFTTDSRMTRINQYPIWFFQKQTRFVEIKIDTWVFYRMLIVAFILPKLCPV